MRRFCSFLLLATLFCFGFSDRAEAQIQVGPRVGFDLGDPGGLVVGADALIRPDLFPLSFQGVVDYYVVNENDFFNVDVGDVSVTVINLGLNGLYEFGIENDSFTPFAGLGGTMTFTRVSGGSGIPEETEAKLGLNLTGGTYFNLGGFKPYTQANIKVGGGDVDLFSIVLGFRFGVGGN